MTETDAEQGGLTDDVKASVLNAGVVSQLKHAMHGNKAHDSDMQALTKDAQAMAEALQQLLDSDGLDDAVAQKLSAVLSRLKGVLHGGHVSREALATMLSEATAVIGVAESSGKAPDVVTAEQLWHKIQSYNKQIDDDFEKMRNTGILFDEKLWNKHLQLSLYLKEHPHDITKQKELDATDDALLLQAEPQLHKCPGAKPAFDDAKKNSDDRQKVVDQDLAGSKNKDAVLDANSGLDWGASAPTQTHQNAPVQEVTMNDVQSQNVGQKQKSNGKNLNC